MRRAILFAGLVLAAGCGKKTQADDEGDGGGGGKPTPAESRPAPQADSLVGVWRDEKTGGPGQPFVYFHFRDDGTSELGIWSDDPAVQQQLGGKPQVDRAGRYRVLPGGELEIRSADGTGKPRTSKYKIEGSRLTIAGNGSTINYVRAELKSSAASPGQPRATATDVVDAADLYAAYKDDSVAATAKYGGRTIRVRIRVDEASPQFGQLKVVQVVGQFSGVSVDVSVHVPNDVAAKLKKGQVVVVRSAVQSVNQFGVSLKDVAAGDLELP